MMLKNLMILVAVGLFSLTSFAELMTPANRSGAIRQSDDLSALAKKSLEARCAKIVRVYSGTRETCALTAANFKMTARTVDFCSQADDAVLEYCLKSVRDRDVSEAVLKVCSQVKGRGYYFYDPAICVNYFAENNAYYDSELVSYCFSQFSNSFAQSRDCLNAIRDRQGSTEELKKECQGKAHSVSDQSQETLGACIDRVMRKQALAEPLNCQPGSRAGAVPTLRPVLTSPTAAGQR